MDAVLEFIAFEAGSTIGINTSFEVFGLGVLVEGVESILEVEAGSSEANNGEC